MLYHQDETIVTLIVTQSLINAFNTSDTQYRDILGATYAMLF